MTERSMRVMIVDDEEVLRDVLEVVLRREGFDVVLAASGEEALNLLDGDEVDRKSTRLNSSHIPLSRMPSSA